MENESISPSRELRGKWEEEFLAHWDDPEDDELSLPEYKMWDRLRTKQRLLKDFLIDRAARWAADQEPQKCFDAIRDSHAYGIQDAEWLLEVRRPREKSLKEKALSDLSVLIRNTQYSRATYENIRLALESLPNE